MRAALVAILVLTAALALNPNATQAQWYGAATTCQAPYDYGWSGYFGSTCQSTAGYQGWGYGGVQQQGYAVGNGWGYPYYQQSAAYSPWSWASAGVSYCRGWWGC